jgi:hypothetical protein
MTKPNKTVGNWRRKNPFPPSTRPVDPFIDWMYAEVQKGRLFSSMSEAEKEYRSKLGLKIK